MSHHLTDEALILHFYGEAPGEAARVDHHLAECATCRDDWSVLQRTLALVDTAKVGEAPDGFERAMWARLQPQLSTKSATLPWWSVRFWAPAAVLGVVVVAAFVGGRMWQRSIAPDPPRREAAGSTDPRAMRERVLLSALGDHFEQTERLLVEIKNSPDGGGEEFGAEQQTARDLVAAGRLYRETAQQDGDAQLGAVLEDLERVLVDVADPTRLSPQDLKSLRTRIEDDSLVFKVRALATAARERERRLTAKSGDSI